VTTLVEKETRKQRRYRAQAQKLAGPSTEVLAYGSGVGHVRTSRALIWLVSIYAVLFIVLLVLAGVLLFPGLLFLAVVVALMQPRRGIAVAPVGLLVTSESLVDGKAKRILFRAPVSDLSNIDQGRRRKPSRRVRVHVREERIRLKRSVYDTLAAAAQSVPTHGSPGGPVNYPVESPVGPGWFPDPNQRFEYRYWDGEFWTPHTSTGGVTFVDPPNNANGE
jgi:uncharacterized protein DUF2510